ncbi:hypothetical protein AB0I00_37815 [Streptomyces sp. NPDC050803]|uniref:hypothetical protein n=1 Tax=unclassified Streptomyces TaxID=2593676 RepID=UPI00341C773C
MPSPPSALPPDEPGTDAPGAPGPLARAAAVLRKALWPSSRTVERPATPPGRLALDLADCRRERDRWQRHADSYERELTRALRERASLLAWLAALHPASAAVTPDADGGHVLCVQAGGRRLCWPLASADLPLFAHVPYRDPVAPPSRGDAPTPVDQATHLRRHIRLLALEGVLPPAPPETPPRGRPLRSGDH